MEYFEAKSPLFPEILALHGKWRANQDAVICADQTLNWKQFVSANHRFANGLIQHGINVGDRVGIVMSNGIPMLQAIMGVMAAGAVSVPINLSVSDAAVVSMLRDAEVVAVVVTSDQLLRLEQIKDQLPDSLKLYISDQPANNNWLSIEVLCRDQSSQLPHVTITESDQLNIIYSSGTTGTPKGIVHNHAGRRDWAYDLAIALRYHCSSRTLLTLGLYSNISWVGILATLLAGGTLVIQKKFDANQALHAIDSHHITHTSLVPIQFQRMIDCIAAAPQKYKLSSMHAMMSCGSSLRAELKQKIFEYFPCGVIELYGLTEGVITTLEPEQAEGRWSSVGKPLIGTDILIVDDNNKQLGSGQSGEIVSCGRISMPGYLNRPDANKEATYVDENGKRWLRTGDIGYLDEEGYLFIVDRKKDMILSGGQNIYPQDIEAVLITNPHVVDVAVIAAASERWGETPIAVVVTEQEQADSEAILNWVNPKLGKQQRIADVVFIDQIPRNPNGKILKRELRKKFADKKYT